MSETSRMEEKSVIRTAKVEEKSVNMTAKVEEKSVIRTAKVEEKSVIMTAKVEEKSVIRTAKVEEKSVRTAKVEEKSVIGTSKISELPFTQLIEDTRKARLHKTKESVYCFNLRNPSGWGSLTQDILVHIYKYLSLNDRARLASVCRNLNTVFHLPELWRKFEFELSQNASSYLKSTPKGLMQMVLQHHANHLKFVTIRLDNNRKSGEMASEILSKLVNCSLKTLDLMSTAMPAAKLDREKFVSALTVVFVNSNSLSSLALDDTPVDDPSLETLARSNQDSLQLLSMDSCPNASTRGITFVADQCRRLHELTIDYSHLSDELLLSLSRDEHVKLKQLRLNIVKHESDNYPFHTISGESWQALARHSPQLSLVMYFYVLNDDDYDPFFLQLIPVTHVYFGRSVSKDVLRRLSLFCPKLKELVICTNGLNLLDNELIKIAQDCKEFCSLGLGECEVSCSGMVEIAKICGNRLCQLFVREQVLIEDIKYDIFTMQDEVSKFLGRQWHVECMPGLDY